MTEPATGTYKWALIQEAHDREVEFRSGESDSWSRIKPSHCAWDGASRYLEWRLWRSAPPDITVQGGTPAWALLMLLSGVKVRADIWAAPEYIWMDCTGIIRDEEDQPMDALIEFLHETSWELAR